MYPLAKSFIKFTLRRFGFCQWCGRRVAKLPGNTRAPYKATCDHIIPKSKGGSNKWHNLCLACQECNTKKQNNIWDRCRLLGPNDWQEVLTSEKKLLEDLKTQCVVEHAEKQEKQSTDDRVL